jgi:hypothetical protein
MAACLWHRLDATPCRRRSAFRDAATPNNQHAITVASLVALALAIAACGGPAPKSTPQPTPSPTATATPAPDVTPPAPIAFDMRETYAYGDPVAIAIVNHSPDVYYYQFLYPACYNLRFFDDATEPRPFPIEESVRTVPLMETGRFIAPEGTHCDVISEDGLQPGERVVLLAWEQRRCIVDAWGCRESVQVEPGNFRIEGRFSPESGVVGPGQSSSSEPVTTVEWSFVIGSP